MTDGVEELNTVFSGFNRAEASTQVVTRHLQHRDGVD